MTIYIGADHRGFPIKEDLKKWLNEEGHQVVDLGNSHYEEGDDYLDFAFPVAEKVASQREARGIVICGSGVGVCIAANRVKAVRAALGLAADVVQHARSNDDVNVLALAANYTPFEKMKEMVNVFLTTPFLNEERYIRRNEKLDTYGVHKL